LQAFSTAILKEPKKVYQDNLPDPLETWKDTLNHIYKAEFMQATEVKY
jgi:hypothetical protein